MGPWTKIAALFVLSAPLGLFASACAGTEPSTGNDPAADTATDTSEISGEASSAEEIASRRGGCERRCREVYDECWRRNRYENEGRYERERRCRYEQDRCMDGCRRY